MNRLRVFVVLFVCYTLGLSAQIRVANTGVTYFGENNATHLNSSIMYLGNPSYASWTLSQDNYTLRLSPRSTWGAPFAINDSGDVGIKMNASYSYSLSVNGSVRASGSFITSNERLKRNIKPLLPIANGLYGLNAKNYEKLPLPNEFTSQEEKAEKKGNIEYGFLAQELKSIYPELVSEDENGYLSINYIGLIPVIVEALKEQNRIVSEQQVLIDDLKLAVASLKFSGWQIRIN